MSDLKWKRPNCVPFPHVWHTFQAKDRDSDNLVNYRVQDIPEDRFNDAVEHMVEYFLDCEPLCVALDTQSCPDAVHDCRKFYNELVQHKTSLACFKEGSDELIGINMLVIMGQSDKIAMPKAAKWRSVIEGVYYAADHVNIYEKYNCNLYMSAFGLCIHRNYTGRGIAQQMLAARAPFGRAIGVPVTSTVFTNIASQIPAARAGFHEDYECTGEELAEHGMNFPGLKPIKAMSWKFD